MAISLAYPQTFAGMRDRIASEMARPDLTDDIEMAIMDAIAVYQKERFRFSDVIPTVPPTFNTEAGRYIYTSADNANISTLFNFDYALITIGNSLEELDYISPAVLKQYNQTTTMQGQPSWYSYEGNQFMLAAIPNQVWQITLGIFRRVAAPDSEDEENNPWMTDGERLIRSRAKYELATHKTRNPTMAQAMSPSPPAENGGAVGAAYREWKSLKGEANRVTGSGKIRPMPF